MRVTGGGDRTCRRRLDLLERRRPSAMSNRLSVSVTIPIAAMLFLAASVSCGQTGTPSAAAELEPLAYTVDLTDRTDDTFKVRLRVDDLAAANAVYQFASTAPGTYQVMDIGRFVRSFEAVDSSGAVIPSERVSTNQWRISRPEDVVEIRYELAETWDTPVDENPVYLMCGTSIEDDHVQINGQAVFGYPTGMQARPLSIELLRPEGWIVGTALDTNAAGRYLADDYDQVVDSPILTGVLSLASLDVRGTDVDIFTYSKTHAVESERILAAVSDILNAAGDFLGELPVDRYAFLFHFEDASMGAWEHSYSSTYTFAESDFEALLPEEIPSVVAHEFLHIVTPLNIHSEIIEQFNFVTPTPSEHVWLYEGTTEWMAQISQVRGGVIDGEAYLARLSDKLRANDGFDPQWSISDMSLKSYSAKGQREWGNIYQRGAIVAGLLDLEILSRSQGRRGLREVILELADKYGPDAAFDETGFFDEIAAMTYPEIRPFFERYVRDTRPLPLREVFAPVGVEYVTEVGTGEMVASFGVQVGAQGDRLAFVGVGDVAAECGLATGDVLLSLDDADVTLATAQQAFARLHALGADEPFDLRVRRGDAEVEMTCAKKLIERVERHVLRFDPDATPEQLALREAWLTNLPVPN
jgi:predicted metalloprotease with PDZ domain